MADTPTSEHGAGELPFLTLWYRFLFFDWLFADPGAARNVVERHAALRHNRAMCRHFPTYLRRWSALTLFGFGMGCLFERSMQASLWPAWFFTCACLSMTGMVVMLVAWACLANARVQ
ncbi:hypothetical protein [Massilia sp. CCM 8734]|uniref:hypothetical protein n=1 Tax=Massilia sp. CCM 8734 TaxID=2609283 RepID=UPI0014215A39|nr:hypothetical protein [Massilia sp. CCM 8734]NHZ98010.1 hypothetical protein [Massilia sp. CCM 8734]